MLSKLSLRRATAVGLGGVFVVGAPAAPFLFEADHFLVAGTVSLSLLGVLFLFLGLGR